jgi:EpsI family protein
LSGVDFSISGSYDCAGQTVNVFAAGYHGSPQNKELVGESDHLLLASRNAVEKSIRSVDFEHGAQMRVREAVLDDRERRSLVWYWYLVGDSTAISPTVVKVRQVLDVLRGRRAGGAMLWLETPLNDETVEQGRERLLPLTRALASFGVVGNDDDSR